MMKEGGSFASPIRKNPTPRPPYEPYYIYVLLAFLAYMMADLLITHYRYLFIPTKVPPQKLYREPKIQFPNRTQYSDILARNIFNFDGKIPDPLSSGGSQQADQNAPAVLSQLPLTLVGTIVHVNPKKSIASIQSRTSNLIVPYSEGDDIDGMASLVKIERRKATFRNSNNNRMEYIEIPENARWNFGTNRPPPQGLGTESTTIRQDGNNFSIKRDEILKYTANLPDLLRQARAIPHFLPGSGGQIDGYTLVEIEQDSVFEKLGMRIKDIIKKVNGEPVTNPEKAMELYSTLRSSNNISIEVERAGRNETLNYRIE